METLAMETATTPVPATMSLWDLCLQGGWSMIPLALLLLLCVYVFVERLVVLRAAGPPKTPTYEPYPRLHPRRRD